jgi:ribosomal protein S21|tara:strand:+ start:2587 stop:2838 length:252 start_codon:yes stop_codon:yes gene_type:complete
MKYDNKNRPKRDFKNTEVPFDIMLRQFKKYCERKGIVEEVRERRYFLKPSFIKNEKNQKQKRRNELNRIRASKSVRRPTGLQR